MPKLAITSFTPWPAAAGIACLAMSVAPAAIAQEVSEKTLVDRLQIQDLITRYYNNFGREDAESFADFYADDAELILGTRSYKGKNGILEAYGRAPGQTPRKAPERFQFIVTISNPLIVVHGNTATAQMVFTEFVVEKQGEKPNVIVQGKEYGTFVKTKGHWRYSKRQIAAGTEPPAGWRE